MTRVALLGPRPAGRPRLAVWKFASCDGCQLSLLDCERELLTIFDRLTLAYFPEASSAMADGPYDLSLVEGSVSAPGDDERIREIREQSTVLVTIGACATAGGIQALRNGADLAELTAAVYAEPSQIASLATSTGIAEHVDVDFELRGCPIDRGQLLEVVAAYLAGRPPRIPSTSVCTECKARLMPCVMVARGEPCLGPVTHGGCGALCPGFDRGCYGCFGPAESATAVELDRHLGDVGVTPRARERLWRGYSGWSPEFRAAAASAADDGRSSAAPPGSPGGVRGHGDG